MTIYQIDAFTDTVFKGNPAAVVPLQNWMEEETMQQIALENNLSETAYIVKTEDGYHIRWFTPEKGVDLCGHATLASAYVIKTFLEPHVQEVRFTTQTAGELKTYIGDGLYTLDFPARMPQPCETPPNLLQSLGVTAAIEVLRSRDYLVVLPNEEAVYKIEPDFPMMKELDAFGAIVTARGHSADVVSRCFYPGAGINEDPVTGSAHCTLVPYWCEKLATNKLFAKQVSRRGGNLWCELSGERVLLSGKCVLYMHGEITV